MPETVNSYFTFAVATDVKVCFCDPQSPWQRGTNENTNLLLRQYFPRGTNLSAYSQAQLDHIEQVGSKPTKLFALFNSPVFEEISISKWLAGNPASSVADNFGISKEEVGRLPKKALGIIK